MKVVYTHSAKEDLKRIYQYILYELSAPITAQNTSDRIMDSIRSLNTMPERNPLYKEEPWYSRGVRFISVRNYLVFYTIDSKSDCVYIVRIVYGARDISRQLEEVLG